MADRGIETVGFDYLQDVEDPSSELEALNFAETLADDAVLTETMIVDGLSVRSFSHGSRKIYALVARAVREKDGDLAEAQRLTQLSSSEFYRRLRELRYRLVCLELAPRAWLFRP